MRRLLVLALIVPAALTALPAHAGCDENGCYPSDCLVWNPHPPSSWKDVVADPASAVTWVLPPVCPT